MGADNGSFPSGIVVLAAGSDWKSTAGPRPVRGSGVLGPPAPPRPAPREPETGNTRWTGEQEVPGSSREGRSEFTDETQVTRRPGSVPGRAVEGAEDTATWRLRAVG